MSREAEMAIFKEKQRREAAAEKEAERKEAASREIRDHKSVKKGDHLFHPVLREVEVVKVNPKSVTVIQPATPHFGTSKIDAREFEKGFVSTPAMQSAAAGDRLTSAADGRKYGDKPPGKGWQGPFKGQRGGTYWLPPKGKQPASKPSRKPKNPKVAKAIQSHKPSTREKQVFALQQEDIVAAGLGGTRLMDNEPMDVILERPPGTLHGFEIKTLTDNTNNKITMHPESRRRKEEWAKGGKRFIHTIVIDGRDEFGEGRNADQYSGHKVYYSTGVGAFRIKSMERAASFDELLERLAI